MFVANLRSDCTHRDAEYRLRIRVFIHLERNFKGLIALFKVCRLLAVSCPILTAVRVLML